MVGNKAKGRISKRELQENKAGHGCVSGGKKCLLFGKFDVLCFLVTPVLKFALINDKVSYDVPPLIYVPNAKRH